MCFCCVWFIVCDGGVGDNIGLFVYYWNLRNCFKINNKSLVIFFVS